MPDWAPTVPGFERAPLPLASHRLRARASDTSGRLLLWCADCPWQERWTGDFDLAADVALARAHHAGEPF